jgi:hypothetical protein
VSSIDYNKGEQSYNVGRSEMKESVQRTMNRAHKLPDPDWEYKMVFLEKGCPGGIAVVLPAGQYEKLGKPRQLTLIVEVERGGF